MQPCTKRIVRVDTDGFRSRGSERILAGSIVVVLSEPRGRHVSVAVLAGGHDGEPFDVYAADLDPLPF